MSNMKKNYDFACLWTGTVLVVGLPITVIFWIWTGEWRLTATLTAIVIAGTLYAIGAKMCINDDEKAGL